MSFIEQLKQHYTDVNIQPFLYSYEVAPQFIKDFLDDGDIEEIQYYGSKNGFQNEKHWYRAYKRGGKKVVYDETGKFWVTERI